MRPKSIQIGTLESNGKAVCLDPTRLVETRLLITANSGGGKSYLIRKLVEELHGKKHILFLDTEGEFSNLRTHYPFILAGKGGDIPSDPRYADTLARKLLELRADTIIDLYELKKHERVRFVKLFLESAVNAPKELWHETVFILDEAQDFAPEKDSADSLGSVIDMASRGRKRGFCLIPATQRFAKLHKDVAAECRNKMIGLANLGLDRKRAAEELGFTDKLEILSLRDFEEGHFYGVGPAFNFKSVEKIQVGQVITKHLKAGNASARTHTPAPDSRVRAVLAKLVDLPKEAEQEQKDIQSLQSKIRDLERQLKTRPLAGSSASIAAPQLSKKELAEISKKAVDEAKAWAMGLISKYAEDSTNAMEKLLKDFSVALQQPHSKLKADFKDAPVFPISGKLSMPPEPRNLLTISPIYPNNSKIFGVLDLPKKIENEGSPDEKEMGRSEKNILAFLWANPGKSYNKAQIGAMTRQAWKGGSFNTYISRLRSSGYITGSGSVQITADGIAKAESLGLEISNDVESNLKSWLEKLGGGAKKIYSYLLENESRGIMDKMQVAEALGMAGGGGSFNTYVSRLVTLGLIVRESGGIRFNPDLKLGG